MYFERIKERKDKIHTFIVKYEQYRTKNIDKSYKE